MKIGINCGHTLPTGGSQGAVGIINESIEDRNVGRILAEILNKRGHTVYDCTNDVAIDVNDNLKKIVTMANSHSLDLFISIHFNAGGGSGTEAYTYNGDKSKVASLSQKITNNISSLGFKNRGAKDGSGLYVLRKSVAPAVLVEVCFVDSENDVKTYKKVTSNDVAVAIANAIDDFYGVQINNFKDEAINVSKFKDIQGHYAQKHIEKLEKYGIINGDGNGKFNPDVPPTRADVAIMIANALSILGK